MSRSRALVIAGFPAVAGAALLALSACAIGSPPGFSDGDTWGFPLVGSLEKGAILAPVKINGKGPFLFLIDPDLPSSAVDPGISTQLQLMPEPGVQVLTQNDNRQPIARARVNEIELGDLRVRNRVVFVKQPMMYRGRLVRGAIGRDVIAASLIFQIDRDRAMGYLGTQGHLDPPPEAEKIDYRLVQDRYLTKVKLNGKHDAVMHMDLGSSLSSLWPELQEEYKFPRIPRKEVVRDEYGFEVETDKVAMVAKVEAGGLEVGGVEFVPFTDQRIEQTDYDGELGQSFFFPYHVTVNFNDTAVWLKRRTADLVGTAKQRMRRWGSRFDGCALPACVKVALEPVGGTRCAAAGEDGREGGSGSDGGDTRPVGSESGSPEDLEGTGVAGDPEEGVANGDHPGGAKTDSAPAVDAVAGDETAGAPEPDCQEQAPQFHQLQIGREGMAIPLEYEVVLLAVDENMQPLGLPLLQATLPKNVETVYHPVRDAAYAKAHSFVAIDLSPFPKPCDKVGGGYRCVWKVE